MTKAGSLVCSKRGRTGARAGSSLLDSVDVHANLLGVEADQPGDLLALRTRLRVRPHQIGEDAVADSDRPVLGLPLYGQWLTVPVGVSRSMRTCVVGRQ